MAGGGVIISGTTDTARVEAPITIRAYLICAFAAFGGIFFGYDTGWMSGVLAMPYFIRQYTNLPYPDPNDDAAVKAFHLPASDQSLTTSILSCGTFFGAIVAGDIADFIGRRSTIIAGCAVFIVGCILQTASTSLGLMVPGRLICGVGVGFISAIVILYMSVRRSLPRPLKSKSLTVIPRVGNRAQGCAWSSRRWLPILHYYWHLVSQLCRICDSESRRYWFLSHSHRHTIPVGYHPSAWAVLPARIATLLCKKGQTRFGSEGAVVHPGPADRFGVYY